MAAAKRKKKSTKRKTTKKKTITQTQSNLVRVCLLLFGIALSIITIMQLGIVGELLYGFVNYLFGVLTIPLLILAMAFSIVSLVKRDGLNIPARYSVGVGLLLVAWLLFESIGEFKYAPEISKFGNFIKTLSNFSDIVIHGRATPAGLLGALLYCVFVSLFDVIGSYVFVFLFVLIGLLLISYDVLLDALRNRKAKPKAKEVKKVVKKKAKKEVEMDDLLLDMDQAEEINPFQEVHVPEPIDSSQDEPVVKKPKKKVVKEKKKEPTPVYMPFKEEVYKDYKLPSLSVLDPVEKKSKNSVNATAAKEQGRKLIEILNEFGVEAQLVKIHIGPSVTKFEIKPELGVRVNKISNLQNDIKMGLAAKDIRIEAPIPGKASVGIEIPNVEKTSVQMKDLMRTIPDSMKDKKLLFCLGKDLMGNNVYGELNRMPHLLIAGATGSGKSVCVNAIISSILMRTKPDEVKLVLIDPKKVEFTPYNDVPHLLSPVITDGDLANKALKVIVEMMDRRYDLFGELGVRNITAYNEYVKNHEDDHLKVLPRIVIIIDELADLMLVAAKEVEASIQRITQLARAAGIHLIVATQRPSVDVITGVIKANIPSRIAFAVSQSVDSRTILDQAGAERLLGNGDMLYLPNGETSPRRIQGVFIKDEEVNNICAFVKSQAKPKYDDAFIQLKDLQNQGNEAGNVTADPLYEEVKRFVIASRKASTSLIQRKFSVGYSRAARLMDVLEANGIIGPARGSKPREILVQNTLEDGIDSI